MKHLITLLVVLTAGSLVAGSLDPAQQKWIDRYQKAKQKNLPDAAAMLLNADPEPELKTGFVPLFNGKDLTGWTPVGGTCTYEIKEGCVVGTTIKGSASTYLCTDKADYADFIFVCEMKWNVDGNSGIMFRTQTKETKKGKTAFGPQVEMEGIGDARDWSGGLYGQGCGGWYYPLWLEEHKAARAAFKEGEWNRVTIKAQGNVVKTWINAVPVAHWVNDEYMKGCFGLQVHSGSKGEILWRNLKVKEL
ncbi:MAG: DUF1080 domain-containing protein [Kiritimatiellae bacterium]|jgi:hypothetical protein|nr:DUF1080 domain-containing protein [Kiritimatiellia bacterium]